VVTGGRPTEGRVSLSHRNTKVATDLMSMISQLETGEGR
jgi:hypothetical protein